VLVIGIVLAAVSMARGYGSPVAANAPTIVPVDTVSPPVEPTGVETVTPDDLALLAREIAMPLDGIDPATLKSNFEERRAGGLRQHNALDIMAPKRTPVHSAVKGRVLRLFTSVAGGLMVYAADSSERFICMYAHLDSYAPGLKDGAPLARGQLIGYVGSTGNALASAPHLHFAIARSADVKRWSKGKPIDPLPVLRAGAP
jgi:murein DD-endopeptidase MepM/ murein hydrolase activator NlpD